MAPSTLKASGWMQLSKQSGDTASRETVSEDVRLSDKYTRREWWTLLCIGSVNFFTALCISLQAPFYPLEAESKGATATEYGFVFGIYELIGFIFAPIYGKYMNKLGVTFMIRSGVFVAGTSVMIFGCLDIVQGGGEFIGLSFAVRIMEALGGSAVLTSSFAIVATIFPNSVATVFALLETLFGIGSIVGPAVGGLLFTVGGFKLPFLVVGGLLLLDGVIIYFMLPVIADGVPRPQAQLLSFLKLTPVLLAMMSVTTATIAQGYITAVLEPHLRQFNLSAISTGLVFVVNGVMYAIVSPLVGRLCDKHVAPMKMLLLGFVLGITSFLLTGPVPFTPFQPQLWLIIVGMLAQGASNALLVVPAFILAIQSAVARGLPDDITTYGVVSGLWGSSFALGAFIGPSIAGTLFDAVGFRVGTLFVIAIDALMFIAMTTYVCLEKRGSPRPLCRDVTASSPLSHDASTYGSVISHKESA